jgi:hypothetical protein
MTLQNRVDPFGNIHADPARGLFMGNRGIIHNPETRTLARRRWATKAWIICLCSFKGRRRTLMGRGSYTELFFLDEATALAAGHRPCFECQREKAAAFAAAFSAANGLEDKRTGSIDGLLHGERTAVGHEPAPIDPPLQELPDGAIVAREGTAYLVLGGELLRWSFGGYQRPDTPPEAAGLRLLTPPSTVKALIEGYRPLLHPSALVAASGA